jgi:hypothetical protein
VPHIVPVMTAAVDRGRHRQSVAHGLDEPFDAHCRCPAYGERLPRHVAAPAPPRAPCLGPKPDVDRTDRIATNDWNPDWRPCPDAAPRPRASAAPLSRPALPSASTNQRVARGKECAIEAAVRQPASFIIFATRTPE